MPLMVVSLAATLVMLSTFAFSFSLAASTGRQNGIRLVHGFTENEGIVEVQRMEVRKEVAMGVAWGTVCVPSSPSPVIGTVVCRQLGYDAFGGFPAFNQSTSLDSRRVALKVLSCKGDEERLENCNTTAFPDRTSCSHLAVLCANNGTVRFGSAPPDAAAHSGVVEAFVEGEWQDVCPQRTNSANYLCAQLGYSTALGSSMMTTAPSGSTYTPDWNNNDSRCRHDMYSTEGCVWYHKEGVCKGDTNLRITCAGPPEKVAQPSVTVTSISSAEVSWPSLAGRNSAVDNYTVVYWQTGTDRNSASNFKTVDASPDGGSLKLKLTGLTTDTEYSIEIAGVSGSTGPGEFSEPVTFRTHIELKKLNKLEDLNATAQQDGSIAITYKLLNSRKVRHVEIRFWTVAGLEAKSNAWFVSSRADSQKTVYLRGLLPSTNYTAQLRAMSRISNVKVVGDYSEINFTTPADNTTTTLHPAPAALTAKRVSTSLVELSWTHITKSQFRWSCVSMSEQLEVEGVHKGEGIPVDRPSINMPSPTPKTGEKLQYSVNISLVNMEFNCKVAAEDENGMQTSGHTPEQKVVPFITSPPSVSIKTHVQGSVVLIDWEVVSSSRRRRQSEQTVEPLALSINCSFVDVDQVRNYFWWSPSVGESLTLESLPLGSSGTCGAALYTLEGPGIVYDFPISTEPVPVVDLLVLLSPIVSGKNVTIEWTLPHDIVPSKTKVVVWETSDLSTSSATEHTMKDSSVRMMNLMLTPGVKYVYRVLVDVKDGGRLESNPVQVHLPNDITAAPRSSFGSVGDDDTSLTVHWNTVADAAGYIIMATSYTGTLRNETLTRVVLDPTSSSAVIPFDIECASKFTFKVAPFNSLGIGPYSEEVEVGTQNEHCVATNTGVASQDQLLVYGLLGLLAASVFVLIVAGVTIFCLLLRNCSQKRNRQRMIADGPLSSRKRRSTGSSIRDSIRYIGVRKIVREEEEQEGEKEKELKSRPLPIPTESDLEDEEEEEEMRANNGSRLSYNASPLKVSPMEKDAGYSSIPGDVRESIIQSSHRTSTEHLLEQGYEMVHPSSEHYQAPRSKSTSSPNFYNVPRGSTPVGEYELPVTSRSHSPAGLPSRHSLQTQSAPHPLTYDVPTSRVAPREVVPGQFGIPSASNHLYGNMSDTYDVPKSSNSNPQLISAGSESQAPATYDVPPPPRSSLTGNETYDVPRKPSSGEIPTIPASQQNGQVDSTYDKLATVVPGPKTVHQEPDNTYDVPSSCPARNENNYDVLPRTPRLSPHSSHSPTSPEDLPQVLTTPKRSRRFAPQSPTANSPGADSAHPTNEGFSSVPQPSPGGEGYYDVLPKRPVTKENGQPVQNVEGYYDMPSSRPVADVHVLVEEENQGLQNGDSAEDVSPADTSIDNAPETEGTPKSKSEHPYSKVKRLVSSDGKEQKVTVMEDSEDELNGKVETAYSKDRTPITLV